MQLPKLNKKGMSIGQLPQIAIIFAVAFIVLGIASVILTEVNNDQTADGYADNITTKGLEGMQKIGNWGSILGICVGAALVISVIVGSLMPGKQGGL